MVKSLIYIVITQLTLELDLDDFTERMHWMKEKIDTWLYDNNRM